MITAHLPAGYALAQMKDWRGPALAAALVGSVFPDLDLLAFYFIDDRAVHHHRYWVHAPGFALACSAALWALSPRKYRPVALAFGAAWGVHLCLDSVVGQVMWLWPFSERGYGLFVVPGVEGQHFLITMLLHWSMVFELAIWALALTLFIRSRRARR